MKFLIIGLSNAPTYPLPDAAKHAISTHHFFSGGKRHYELIKKHLPLHHEWIDLKSPLNEVFEKYVKLVKPIVIFTTGDPLFYGFATTLQRQFPAAVIEVYPYFNCIQILCHKILQPYHHITYASVHGRDWKELDQALIAQSSLIGVLTDHEKNPSKIGARLIEYGFNHYEMVVGENLEGIDEKVTILPLSDAAFGNFSSLNCVLLRKTKIKNLKLGIRDIDFKTLQGRPNMITKMPVRLYSLALLNLGERSVLWDIGFCTGSVSIEAKKIFPHLNIVAFEIRKECDELFETNTHTLSMPGITKIIKDFFSVSLKELPIPDAVFIGGHGNRLKEMILLIDQFLPVHGNVGMNTVTDNSKTIFLETFKKLGYEIPEPTVLKVNEHNPITILSAYKIK